MAHATLQTPAVALLLITLAIASATDLRGRVIPNWLVGLAALAGLTLATAGVRSSRHCWRGSWPQHRFWAPP